MSMQRKFWSGIGQTSGDGKTLPTLLATPQARDHFPPNSRERIERQRQKGFGTRALNDDANYMSISSVVDSPASLFRWLEPDEGAVMTAGSGQPFAWLSDCFNHDTFLSRTCRDCCQRTDSDSELRKNAYAAGLIDGEGCISIYARSEKYYSINVVVGMTEPALNTLQWLETNYGGRIRQSRKPSKKWAAAYEWGVFATNAANFLMKVVPYLKLKLPQADCALALWDMMEQAKRRPNGSAHWTSEMREKGFTLKQYMHKSNAKGPQLSDGEDELCAVRRAGQTWVTRQQTLFGANSLEEYCETWPSSGTMRNGKCYRQLPLVRRISDEESSLLPTPYGLSGNQGQGDGEFGKAIRLIATPTGRDFRSGNASEQTMARNSRPLSEQIGGLLNPQFVEAMMGLPIGWTDCDASAMPSSPKSQSGSDGES